MTPYVVHQSDLSSWNYCPARTGFELAGFPQKQNSALSYGTVLHHAMHVLERFKDLDKAIETFLFYWHPLNIDELCPPVPADGWIGRDSYGELRKRGVDTLRKYADYLRHDDHELLGLEYSFAVPVRGLELDGRPVVLAGTIDRLAVRWFRQRETLMVDDFKTGAQKWNLRHNIQGTAYSYATWQPEFWTGTKAFTGLRLDGNPKDYDATSGFDDQHPLNERFHTRATELIDRFATAPRRFTWINLKSFKLVDGGYRGPQDFERMKTGISTVLRSAHASIFPLRIDGETCRYCPFRAECGVPHDDYADPAYALEVTE
jgi:hypothetical protein